MSSRAYQQMCSLRWWLPWRLWLLCLVIVVPWSVKRLLDSPALSAVKQDHVDAEVYLPDVLRLEIGQYHHETPAADVGHKGGWGEAIVDEVSMMEAIYKEKSQRILHCVTNKSIRAYGMREVETAIIGDVPPYLKTEESDTHRKESFEEIFSKKKWGGRGRGEHIYGSGPGSTLNNTVKVRAALNAVIDYVKMQLHKEVVTLLDVPCGDFVWMKEFLGQRQDVQYTGMDIVTDLISHHNEAHRDQSPRWRFIQQDIVAESLNQSYDLVFSRQMTQHLVLRDAYVVLQHISRSKSQFLFATTYPTYQNEELNYATEWRASPQNLEMPPFSLTPPICMSHEEEVDFIALWRLPLKRIVTCEIIGSVKPVLFGRDDLYYSCAS